MAYQTKIPANVERADNRASSSQTVKQAAGFFDNRTATGAQLRLADLAARSPKAVAQRVLAETMNRNQNTVLQPKKITVDKNDPQTEVNWTEGKLKGSDEPVGTLMIAKSLHYGNVDEGALIGSSPKASAQKDLMGTMPTAPKNSSANKFIKGHLLNHNIGGPGLDFNMFPITASANSLHHSFVEKTVKKWVNKDKNTVDYGVAVKSIDDHTDGGAKAGHVNSVFDCQAVNHDTKETLGAEIASNYQIKATGTKKGLMGLAIDLSSDDLDYPPSSLFGKLFVALKDEDDQAKVDAAVKVTAKEVMKKVSDGFDGDQPKKPETMVVKEAFNTKGKRFTDRQQKILNGIAIDVIEAFVVSNDKGEQAEHEQDYPTLVAFMKKA